METITISTKAREDTVSPFISRILDEMDTGMLNALPKAYTVKAVTYLGYVVEDNSTGDMSVQTEDWIVRESSKISNLLYITPEKEPLLYVRGVRHNTIACGRGVPEEYNVFFLGCQPVSITVTYNISDQDPELRNYSYSITQLGGKRDIEGTLKSIRLEITEAYNIEYSNFSVVLQYTGKLDTKFYKYALENEEGNLRRDADGNINFISKRTLAFQRYRSGCGCAEYYIVPNSSYQKYIETFALLPKLGGHVKVNHMVADDPEFVHEQKIKSCNRELCISSDTYDGCEGGEHYSETVSQILLKLREYGDGVCGVNVYYIPDEYRHSNKAVEYSREMPVTDFCKEYYDEELISAETVLKILSEAKEVIADAVSKDLPISEKDVTNIKAYHDLTLKGLPG